MSSTPAFLAPLLALVLPGTLFVGCLWSMLVTVRRHRNGLLGAGVYLWLAVDVLVMVFATSWLAKSLQVLWNSGLSAEQAQATLTAGPALFMARPDAPQGGNFNHAGGSQGHGQAPRARINDRRYTSRTRAQVPWRSLQLHLSFEFQ